MWATAGESGNGKLDYQLFFSIHFDLRDCTVSISCYLGHLQKREEDSVEFVEFDKELKFSI